MLPHGTRTIGMIKHVSPGFYLCWADPAQPLTTAGEELDDLYHDLSVRGQEPDYLDHDLSDLSALLNCRYEPSCKNYRPVHKTHITV